MSDIEATDFTLPSPVADGSLDTVVTRYRHRQLSGERMNGTRVSLLCVHAVSYCAFHPLLELFHDPDLRLLLRRQGVVVADARVPL